MVVDLRGSRALFLVVGYYSNEDLEACRHYRIEQGELSYHSNNDYLEICKYTTYQIHELHDHMDHWFTNLRGHMDGQFVAL